MEDDTVHQNPRLKNQPGNQDLVAKSLLDTLTKERDYALRLLSKAQNQLFLKSQKDRASQKQGGQAGQPQVKQPVMESHKEIPITSSYRPPRSVQGRSYASIVNSNPLEKKMRFSFVQSTSSGDMSLFEPDEGILKEAQEKCCDYLLGYFINGNPGFKMVEAAVKGFWGKMGLEEVLADNSGFYIFKILGVHARFKILEGGP